MASLATCISANGVTFKLTRKRAFTLYVWVTACLGVLLLSSPFLRFGFNDAWGNLKQYLHHIGGLLLISPDMLYLYSVALAVILCVLIVEALKLRDIINKSGSLACLLKDRQNLREAVRCILFLPFKIFFYFMSFTGTLYLLLVLVRH